MSDAAKGRDEACTRCGATPETGQGEDCPECQGIVGPLRESPAATSWEPRLGEVVAVRDASGNYLRKVVVEVNTGRDFPCHDVAWENDQSWVPWPIEDVFPLMEHANALTRAQFLALGRNGWPALPKQVTT